MTYRMLLCAAIISGLASVSGTAQAQLNCRVVQSAGNAMANEIRTQINSYMAGYQEKISRRKKLRINRIERVWFEGCRAKIRAHVTLKRKIRRNAHGHIVMSGVVTDYRVRRGSTPGRVCLAKPKVHSVKLSRTLRIGERIYKRVANRTLPGRERCFTH